MTNLTELVEQLSQLTVLEAAELSKLLEEKWGVSAAAPVQVAQVVDAPVEVAEEQTEFDIMLTGIADSTKKIVLIKEVRAITGLGLKEAKEVVESTPKMIKETVNKADADAIRIKIEAAGGSVALQ